MPGKFDNDLDRALYDITLDGGADDQCGDVSEIGFWAGLLHSGADLESAVIKLKIERGYDIPVDELHVLRECAGAIVTEDDQGFVHVDYFDTESELDKQWQACEDDAESAYEEDEWDAASSGEDDGYDSDYADE